MTGKNRLFMILTATFIILTIGHNDEFVMQWTPNTETQLFWIINQTLCEILTQPPILHKPVEIVCQGRLVFRQIKKEAREKRLNFSIMSTISGSKTKRAKEDKLFTSYQSFDDINKHYNWLLKKNTNLVKIEEIGETLEKREIRVVKINSENSKLPIILIDAGIHAREWISPASTMWFATKLVKQLKNKKGDSGIANFQWHIIPVLNPDGYEYSRTDDRWWRKNRNLNKGSDCIGVDLNRNFPTGFGMFASDDPCEETFTGLEPFSEPESRALSNYINKTRKDGGNILIAVSIHSYGNVIMFPSGYTTEKVKRYDELQTLSYAFYRAVYWKTGEIYTPGTPLEVFGFNWGMAGGATDDFYYAQDIPYSYTLELPGSDADGDHGFLLPPSNIIRVGKTIYVGFDKIARKITRMKKN